jgi:hypothetical protein
MMILMRQWQLLFNSSGGTTKRAAYAGDRLPSTTPLSPLSNGRPFLRPKNPARLTDFGKLTGGMFYHGGTVWRTTIA